MRFFNVLGLVAMIGINYLAVALPLNGKSTKELSDQYPNLFIPAGITFSIWGIIYLLLTIFIVTQFLKKYKPTVTTLGYLFIANALLNSLWIISWHYEFVLISVLVMLLLLANLIIVNIKLRNGGPILHQLAFGIYLGWILVATIANITALLVSINWLPYIFSASGWTYIMITMGAIIATVTSIKFKNPFVLISVIWAFAGIYLNRLNDHRNLGNYALALSAVLLLLFMFKIYYLKKFSRANLV